MISIFCLINNISFTIALVKIVKRDRDREREREKEPRSVLGVLSERN